MTDWQAVVAEHGPAVWRTAYRLLKHDADALDCYQDTFLAAYRAADRQPIASWAPFLVSLATRRAIDRLRRRSRERGQASPLDGVPEPVSAASSPVEQAHAAERLDHVRTLLAGLPEKQAEVFWLSCVEGLAHREIAEHLQVREGEVRVLLHRARARLRAALGTGLLDRSVNR